MDDKEPYIDQKAEGTGIAQAAGERATAITIFGIPIQEWLIGILIFSIIFQCLTYTCTLGLRGGNAPGFAPMAYFCLCTTIFGPLALYSLIMGIRLKNNKIVVLSLISGVLPFVTICVLESMISPIFTILNSP